MKMKPFQNLLKTWIAVGSMAAFMGGWVVLGHSAGGLLALHLGTTSRDMAAVVALAPLSCLQWPQQSSTTRESVGRLLGGTPEEIPEVYGAACPSGRTSLVPQCLLHGEADEAVPLEMSRHFCALRGLDPCPVTLLALPGVDHFQIIDPQSTAREPLFAALEKASRH